MCTGSFFRGTIMYGTIMGPRAALRAFAVCMLKLLRWKQLIHRGTSVPETSPLRRKVSVFLGPWYPEPIFFLSKKRGPLAKFLRSQNRRESFLIAKFGRSCGNVWFDVCMFSRWHQWTGWGAKSLENIGNMLRTHAHQSQKKMKLPWKNFGILLGPLRVLLSGLEFALDFNFNPLF